MYAWLLTVLKGFASRLTKVDLICLGVVLLISVSLFARYVSANVYTNHSDENGYLSLSGRLASGDFTSSGRTYLYPSIIYVFVSITDHLPVAKVLLGIFQYTIYGITVVILANAVVSRENKKAIWFSIFGLGMINPYLVQACTLFLSDLLASCFAVIAIVHASRSDLRRTSNITPVFGLAYAAVMIRPSSLIFLLVVVCVIAVRGYRGTPINAVKTCLLALGLTAVFVPQLATNVVYFDHWSPFLQADLYSQQTVWAARYLKYGTLSIAGEGSPRYFHSPFPVAEGTSLYQLLRTDPAAFAGVYLTHIFGVIDWGYVDTYIKNFYPLNRIPASLYLYSVWFLVLFGFVESRRNCSRFPFSQSGFLFQGLALAAMVYLIFIATTAVEARFGYPVFLLLLPFAGLGTIAVAFRWRRKDGGRTRVLARRARLLGAYGVFVGAFFGLSFLLDKQTGMIDWFARLGL